jgi:hypothetical protein
MSSVKSQSTICELVDQLKSAYDNLTNAFERAKKEAIKTEISAKATEINEIVNKTASSINSALSRGLVSDIAAFLLELDLASQLKMRWSKAVVEFDKSECLRISVELNSWSSGVLDDINILWTARLAELEQEIQTSVSTILIVKPENSFAGVFNRLSLLRRPNGGFRSILEVSQSTWDSVVNGHQQVVNELESIKDIPEYVMDFLRRQSVSLTEYESEIFKPTRDWIANNPAFASGLTVKWGN